MERNILYREMAGQRNPSLADTELSNNSSYANYEYEAKTAILRPKTIALFNTDLDAPYYGGNFNFTYNGGTNEATVTFNTYLSFRKNYSATQKAGFIDNLKEAVAVWDKAAAVEIADKNGNFNQSIALRFKLNIVRDKKNANKITDIHPENTWSSWFNGKNREIVMRELNVFIGTSRNVLVHELGHVWGLMDEYDTQWIEMKFSPAHVGKNSPLLKDTKAIMNLGYQDELSNSGEFRGRYFKHIGRALLKAFWHIPDYRKPIVFNKKTVSQTLVGRIVLLKKDIAGSAPEASDVLPFNPRHTIIQITKRV